MKKDLLRSALAAYFAPWVQALELQVHDADADSVTLLLPRSEQLSRVGGMVCGQAAPATASVCRAGATYAL